MSGDTTNDFFDEQNEKSAIKTAIVSKFFSVYISIIYNRFKICQNIFYIDLFSGPGKYKNGTPSTPIKIFDVIENASKRIPQLKSKMQFIFNDSDESCCIELQTNLLHHPLYNELKHKPHIYNKLADQVDLKLYTNSRDPIFSFIDPFGYKCTSTQQIWDLIKNQGSDCIFFFNANRFLMDIPKDKRNDFEPLFGKYYEKLPEIRDSNSKHTEKIHNILTLFSKNIIDNIPRNLKIFVLPFGFYFDDKDKQSHYLLFITKNHKAITVMKSVMKKVHNDISEEAGHMGYKVQMVNQTRLFDNESGEGLEDIIDKVIKVIYDSLINAHDDSLFSKVWTEPELMEYVDTQIMHSTFLVTSFTDSEFKNAVRKLADKNCLEFDKPVKYRANETFSDNKEFIIIKDALESYV